MTAPRWKKPPIKASQFLIRLLAVLLILTPLTGKIYAEPSSENDFLYAYSDTRQLIDFVERAAKLVETEGLAAFKKFTVPNSQWYQGQDAYLFAYAQDGTCVLHAQRPELVGQNVIDLKDISGKPIIREIVGIGSRPGRNANGWVFYQWENGTQLTPSWKSAYLRKVITADGKVYVIGSGIYNIKMERRFVRERVDQAVDLLRTQGSKAAFLSFKDPSSPFSFLGSYIFVLNQNGMTLVDPAFPTTPGRDLRNFRDVAGVRPISLLLTQLARQDSTWIQYLWPRPGQAVPTRKIIYARKVKIEDQVMIVGSDYFQATPIWMRD